MAALTAEQARKLHGLISGHVKAQVELSWAGGKSPGEAVEAKADAAEAQKKLKGYIASLRV